jgi:hypothetical protein
MAMNVAAGDHRPVGPAAELQAPGCSLLVLPPLAVLVFGAILLAFALEAGTGDQDKQLAGSIALPLSRIFTPEIQSWSGSIEHWAQAAGLDPNLVAVVMQIESCGDPSARSSAGAIGLFQVMPDHFLASENPFNPDTNATRGLAYLKRSLAAADGNAGLALAGYNGGLGVISNPEWAWPAETQRYSYWGTGIYADASTGASDSPRLAEWLAAGGGALCQSARPSLAIED